MCDTKPVPFVMPYYGKKDKEHKHIEELEGILARYPTVVEPFGGSASLLRCYPRRIAHYVYNDNDPHMVTIINALKNETFYDDIYVPARDMLKTVDKNEWSKMLRRQRTTQEHFMTHKFGIMGRIFPDATHKGSISRRKTADKIDESIFRPHYQIYKNIEVNQLDYRVILSRYVDDPDAFVYLDPPYCMSFNEMYADSDSKDLRDGSIFLHLLEYIKECKGGVIMIINANALTRALFRHYIIGEYDKVYNVTKKRAVHLIVGKYELGSSTLSSRIRELLRRFTIDG